MYALDVAFVVLVALTVGACTVVGRLRSPVGGPRTWAPALAARFGAVPAAVAVAGVGWALTVAVLVPLGLASRAAAPSFDQPVYRWVSGHAQSSDAPVGKVMSTLTEMGNRDFVELVTLAGVLILALAYGRRWWLPVLAVALAVVMQRQGQLVLTHLVPRPSPPEHGAGVFPSGGVSRVLAVFGMLAVLGVRLLPEQQHRWYARAVNGIVLFGVIEAFTRVYTSLHWTSDTLTGFVFGALLLLVETTALYALDGRAVARG